MGNGIVPPLNILFRHMDGEEAGFEEVKESGGRTLCTVTANLLSQDPGGSKVFQNNNFTFLKSIQFPSRGGMCLWGSLQLWAGEATELFLTIKNP